MRNLICLSLMVLLTACGGMKSNNSAPGGPGPIAQAANLQGNWGRLDCQPGATNDPDYIYTLNFNGNRLVSTTRYYFKTSGVAPCTDLAYTEVNEFVIATAASPIAASTYQMDSTMIRATITVADAQLAADFNASHEYGYNNWITNQPTVFTNLDPQYFRVVDYDLILTSATTLYWGDRSGGMDGSTPAKRPVRIDFNNADYLL